MSNNWIYVGADINRTEWSKVGKTTIGLNTRHTSSQNPGYLIFTAYNIVNGDVHEIESNLIKSLMKKHSLKREVHFSTGSPSECFLLNPIEMAAFVERFIEVNYGLSVTYETLIHGEMSRYQCDKNTYRRFEHNYTSDLSSSISPPSSLELSGSDYFPDNQVEYEVDLGDGHYLDLVSGLQKHRADDEDFDDDDFDGKYNW